MAITPIELTQSKDAQTLSNQPLATEDPELIRRQIERTRTEMGHTLDEIQKRLSPDYIKQQTQETLREAAVEKVEQMTQTAENTVSNWRSSAMQTIKDNPIPAAMVGIGLGWLFMSNRNDDRGYDDHSYDGYRTMSERYPYADERRYGRSRRVSEPEYYSRDDRDLGAMAGDAQDWVEDTAGTVQRKAKRAANEVSNQASSVAQSVSETVGDAASTVQDYASEMADDAQQKAEQMRMQAQIAADEAQREFNRGVRQTKQTFRNTMEDNPLAIGIAALAAGAVAGLVLPGTRREDEWMGETRDHLLEEASSTVQQTVQKAQTVAERTAQTALDEAKRQADKEKLTLAGATTSTNGETKSSKKA